MTDGKIYIAESFTDFMQYCGRHGDGFSNIKPRQYISPSDKHRLKEHELSWQQVVIIGDPRLPFSFWQELLTRIRK